MTASTIAAPMAADEFIRFYEGDDENRYELVDGEIVERPMNGYIHDRVKNNLQKLFDRAGVEGQGYVCWIEHSFRVSSESDMTPDVCVIRGDRLDRSTGNSPTTGAPEIAIEVTISDKPGVLQRKISAYLRSGAQAVCCVYPDWKTLVVYTAHEWRELGEPDTLEFPDLLPGLSIPVSAIFENV